MARKPTNVEREAQRKRILAMPVTPKRALGLELAWKAMLQVGVPQLTVASFIKETFEEFLGVALIAEIPPENVDEFLTEVVMYVNAHESSVAKDAVRRQRRIAVNNLINATSRMIHAIEVVEKYTKPGIHVIENPERYTKSGAVKPAYAKEEMVRTGETFFHEFLGLGEFKSTFGSLADIKTKLTALHDIAGNLSTTNLPKRRENRTTNRTAILLKNIWANARKFGGDLTYDLKSDRGTLVEVIEFLRNELGLVLEDLSPSTLERQRPR